MIMAKLTSAPGQTGGVRDLPTDSMAARVGYGTTNLNDPARPPGTDPLGYFSIFDGGNSLVQNKSQSNQTTQTVPPPPPTEPPPPVTPPPYGGGGI